MGVGYYVPPDNTRIYPITMCVAMMTAGHSAVLTVSIDSHIVRSMASIGVTVVTAVHSPVMKKKTRMARGDGAPEVVERSAVQLAIDNIGGTMDEVAIKVGVSRRTLFRMRDRGILNPKRVSHTVMCNFIKLSGIRKEILIGETKSSKSSR
jgi:DNA-binding NtrC family response regulator